MSLTVTPIVEPTITAWQVTPTNPMDTMTALATAATLGYQTSAACQTDESGDPEWTITLFMTGYATQQVTEYGWIVCDGTTMTTYPTNEAFIATYTGNTALVWEPTTTAPAATALPGLQASIVFPQPTSANAPWTYTVEVADSTANTTGAATLVGEPVLYNDTVALTVEDLTEGDEVAFTVTVTTEYEGVSATSVVSNSITATT
jgi:hypothetical protein